MDDGLAAPARHRLTVEADHRRGEAGIFGDNERIELIDGELIDMAPIGSDHAASVDGVAEMLILALQRRAIVRVQGPVRLSGYSEPQPDLTVLRDRPDRYRGGHPQPEDVLLMVEVSDSSLRFDRTVKLPLYARAGIPELWIVDLHRRMLDAYRDPSGDGFRSMRSHGAGDRVALATAPEIELKLERVFD